MKREKKIKIVMIITLVVAVVGMSIGFAVFSNVLTISSSATVTPNEDDFKLTVYGLIDINEMNAISSERAPDLTKWSTTTAYQLNYKLGVFESNEFNAVIDNSQLKISNVSADFVAPPDAVQYYFILKNEGVYDAYLSFADGFLDKMMTMGWSGTCTPGEGATVSLVDAACKAVKFAPEGIMSSNFDTSINDTLNEGSYMLEVNDYIYLPVYI